MDLLIETFEQGIHLTNNYILAVAVTVEILLGEQSSRKGTHIVLRAY